MKQSWDSPEQGGKDRCCRCVHVMTSISSHTVQHTSFTEKIQVSYPTLLVFQVPKGSNSNAFQLWKASWWETIEIKTPLRSTMCNWRDGKNKLLRLAVKLLQSKTRCVLSLSEIYLMAIKAKHPGKDTACDTQMLHYGLPLGRKSKHTQPYIHTHREINQQKRTYSVKSGACHL